MSDSARAPFAHASGARFHSFAQENWEFSDEGLLRVRLASIGASLAP
jgi:nuclear transport factor 2 (NTF2) superfamily protein